MIEKGLSVAILSGLVGMLGWGFADLFAKKTIDEIGDVVSLFWAHVCGVLVLVMVALYQLVLRGRMITIPHNLNSWGLLLFFGALQATVYLLV